MLNSKKFTVILSLIIAVCLWVYVIGETNPTITKNFKGVKIKFVNESVLESYNLAVSNISNTRVDITVKGSRNRISKIKDTDLSAYIDLGEATKGDNQLKLVIQTPNYTECETSSISKVEVAVDNLESKEIPVSVKFNGDIARDKEPVVLEKSIDTATVKGAESIVESIVEAEADIDVSSVGDDIGEFTLKLKVTDSLGNTIPYVTLLQDEVVISAETVKVKTVSLHTNVINENGDELGRTFTAPESVMIKGSSYALSDMDSVETTETDISRITSNKEVPVKLVLPEGVSVADGNTTELKIDVEVEEQISKSFDFSSEDVSLTDLNDDMKAEVKTTPIKVVVSGRKSLIEKIEKKDISLSANLKDLKSGRHNVGISINCDGDYGHGELQVKPKTLTVNLEPKESNNKKGNTNQLTDTETEE